MFRATERTSAPRRDLRWLLLLCLLLLGGTVAASTPELLYRQARAAGEKGDTQKVLAITLEAQKQFGDSDDKHVWWLRCTRAKALVNNSGSGEALSLFQRPLPPSLRQTEIEVLCLQAQAYASASKPEVAEPIIARAYALAREKYPKNLVEVLVLRMIIDRGNAMKWGAEALRVAKQYPDPFAEVRVRGQMGLQFARSERFDEAIDLWEPGLIQARKLGNEAIVEKFEGNLGWGYLELGDYERAEEFFRSAQKTAFRTGQSIDAIPWTYQIGKIRMQEGDLAEAQKQYQIAYGLAKDTGHDQLAGLLTLLATHELMVGNLSEAQRRADESLRAVKSEEAELQAWLISARIAAASGKYDEGERLLRGVLERSESKSGLKSITSEAHVRLAQLYAQKGNATAAEEEFRDSVELAHKARNEIGSQELRFSFFNAVEELFDSYVDFLMARGRDAEALIVTESSRAQTLEEALPDLEQLKDVRTVARNTGATILCYWLGRSQSYLWIVTPQKIDSAKLPPKKTIEAAIDAYQRDLLGPRGTLGGSGRRGEELWRMLVEPASRSIAPGSRVIIVPHGRLNAFNMETLVVPAPQRHYWINDAVIATASSLGLLVRKEPKQAASKRMLLVGNAPPPNKEFAPLPRAGEELNKVASHFRGGVVRLEGAKATPSAYRSASPGGFTYLHFVAHGVAARQKPLDSAVILAREGETFKLYARDIARLPLHAKLVTISSCHGAGTRAYAGEGLVGLGWAFLRAGADNVIAALWEVNDAATPELMDRFYAGLARNDDPATALRDAKLFLLRKGTRPLFWAPFLLYGSS
jgi:CHAT domain-containing protein